MVQISSAEEKHQREIAHQIDNETFIHQYHVTAYITNNKSKAVDTMQNINSQVHKGI